MKQSGEWYEPGRDWVEQVEFDYSEFKAWSTVTVILLGGALIGLVVGLWYLAG